MFLWKQLHPSHIHVKVSHANASWPPRAGCISLKLQRIKPTTKHFYFHRLFFPFKQKTGRTGTLLWAKRVDGLRISGGWYLTLKRAASSNRAARTKRSRKRPGMWASLHSIIWPWCAPEEFNVWKRSGIRDGGRSRWLAGKKRRSRPVVSAVAPPDNIFPAAAPPGFDVTKFYSLSTERPQIHYSSVSKTWALFIRSVNII